jgi:hypothetical protein
MDRACRAAQAALSKSSPSQFSMAACRKSSTYTAVIWHLAVPTGRCSWPPVRIHGMEWKLCALVNAGLSTMACHRCYHTEMCWALIPAHLPCTSDDQPRQHSGRSRKTTCKTPVAAFFNYHVLVPISQVHFCIMDMLFCPHLLHELNASFENIGYFLYRPFQPHHDRGVIHGLMPLPPFPFSTFSPCLSPDIGLGRRWSLKKNPMVPRMHATLKTPTLTPLERKLIPHYTVLSLFPSIMPSKAMRRLLINR